MLFAGNKTFYFDVGSNRYGVFLRISELRANYRTAVTIPENHWSRFRDILNELASKLEGSKVAEAEGEKPPGGMLKKTNGNRGEVSKETPKGSQESSPTPITCESTAISVA